jgi:hypothetical protein
MPLSDAESFEPLDCEEPPGETGPGDSVSWCLQSAKLFDELLRIKSPAKLARFYASEAVDHFADESRVAQVELIPDRDKGIAFKITTDTLFGALWWHLARLLRSDVDIKLCAHCDGLFEAGPGARRGDSDFCCDEHRIKYNSLKRSRRTRK